MGYNIKMFPEEKGWNYVKRIHLAQDRDKWPIMWKR
jgi:hypothetical protein